MAEQVAMTHPDIPGSFAHAFPEAFEVVWKVRGWVITDEPDPEALPIPNEDAVKVADEAAKPAPVKEVKNTTLPGEVGTNG